MSKSVLARLSAQNSDVAKLIAERNELVEALQACVAAASADLVEDFSAVSNAADQARALLERIKP